MGRADREGLPARLGTARPLGSTHSPEGCGSTGMPLAATVTAIIEIVQPTVRRSCQHDWSMRAYGAMPTLPVGIDERHLCARSSMKKAHGLMALISTASSTSTSSSETACPALNVTRATRLPCGSCSGAGDAPARPAADSSRSARACDRPAATGSAAGLAAPVSDSGSGCDAGRRRARSVLTTYPRHGVMRGNHRLTFAR